MSTQQEMIERNYATKCAKCKKSLTMILREPVVGYHTGRNSTLSGLIGGISQSSGDWHCGGCGAPFRAKMAIENNH